ncbi:MAG: phosphoadenosine phosphosulfate reductase family protein [Bacteroidaceae bacterium]|nr:phosphoadenosine phosphosulfate reductase family protein [Bacteroidaceae bacterium]
MIHEIQEKIDKSIDLIQRGERLALMLSPDGYNVGVSGGKDSGVVLDLVKKAGVKYHAYYNVTGIDAPETVRFIRDNYPEVEFKHPEMNFFQIIEKWGMPNRIHPMCCKYMKEIVGVNQVVITGARASESLSRSQYKDFEVVSKRKEHQDGHEVTIEGMIKNEHKCVKGKDVVMLHPILEWTASDVWEYTAANNIPANPLYRHVPRVGCMFCPKAPKGQRQWYMDNYPTYLKRYKLALQRYLESDRNSTPFTDVDTYIEWSFSHDGPMLAWLNNRPSPSDEKMEIERRRAWGLAVESLMLGEDFPFHSSVLEERKEIINRAKTYVRKMLTK